MVAASYVSKTRKPPAGKGFTLIELLVVMAIIATLIALLLPMVHRAYKSAGKARMTADLLVISQALDAYKNDQRDYPRVPVGQSPIDGAVLLCWALVAPDSAKVDGADGPGFRQRGTSGQVYGPYIISERIRVGDVVDAKPTSNDSRAAFLDRYNNAIYYCPATPFADSSKNYVADGGGAIAPKYDHRYFLNSQASANSFIPARPSLGAMRTMFNADGGSGLPSGGTAMVAKDYILWGAGMDQDYNNQNSAVTNFNP